MNTSLAERKKMGELAIKSLFKNAMNLIPIAGPILTDVLFEFRNKVKEERLFKFVDLLKKHFSNENPDINLDSASSAEFSDLFENVLTSVSKTQSDEKTIGFKNLLLHGLKNKEEITDCELFTSVLLNLNDNDILILNMHEDFLYDNKGLLSKKHELRTELDEYKKHEDYNKIQNSLITSTSLANPRNEEDITNDLQRVKIKIEEYRKAINSKSFSIPEGQFIYSIQNLYNKGLLIDEGVGAIGTRPFEIMSITDFGKRFLKFIKYS